MDILKDIFGVIIGTFVGGIIIAIVQTVGMTMYPPPADFDPTVPEQMATLIQNLPIKALLFVPLAYALGSFFGGMLSAKICNQPKYIYALITGGLLMLGGISNLLTFPHPTWLAILNIGVFLPFAFIGGKIGAGAQKGQQLKRKV